MQAVGGQLKEIDFEPFAETARLLYTSAFMAERYKCIRAFMEGKVGPFLHPVQRSNKTRQSHLCYVFYLSEDIKPCTL